LQNRQFHLTHVFWLYKTTGLLRGFILIGKATSLPLNAYIYCQLLSFQLVSFYLPTNIRCEKGRWALDEQNICSIIDAWTPLTA
jgi:hypothetical protein